MGPVATTWVPMGAQVPVLSPNDHANQSWGQEKGFRKKNRTLIFFQVSLNNLHNSKFGAFFWGGGHGTGYIGLPATTWVSMGAQVLILSPNDHSDPS